MEAGQADACFDAEELDGDDSQALPSNVVVVEDGADGQGSSTARQHGLSLPPDAYTACIPMHILHGVRDLLDFASLAAWRMACRHLGEVRVDWTEVAMALIAGGPTLLKAIHDFASEAAWEPKHWARLARTLSRAQFTEFGDVICSLASGKATPRVAVGWRKDAQYAAGISAWGVVAGAALQQLHAVPPQIRHAEFCGKGNIWSTDQLDLRLPFELSFEALIQGNDGGPHLAFSSNRRGWQGANGGSDALTIAAIKRGCWRPQHCDCIWVRDRMFGQEVACQRLAFGTFPVRQWGRVVVRGDGYGSLEVEAFAARLNLVDIVEIGERGRTPTGLPALVHIGFVGWDYHSRADIRNVCLQIGAPPPREPDPPPAGRTRLLGALW